jgi:Spy/CpxP family protein refolding chaperone
MKLKLLVPILATAASLTIAGMAAIAQAQPQLPEPPQVEMGPPPFIGGEGHGPGKNMRGIENIPGLNLTEEQKTKLKALHQTIRPEMEAILTEEQKDALKKARQEGKNPPEAMKSINITDEQKSKIEEVMKSKRQTISEILTPEQMKILEENKPKGRPF